MAELLFVYGTLLCPLVQWRVLGRRVPGEADVLEGFRRDVVCLGGVCYPNLSPAPGRVVPGRVLLLTRGELERVDAYETSAYRRVRVVLQSGRRAFVYVAL